ncbi:hypothetical protein F4805DRAFT_410111 [Annulohypoxylon moriforme]|nr:hypothetical protein F4805DRAFT_410111 [Annulohypoxylon moriforme]
MANEDFYAGYERHYEDDEVPAEPKEPGDEVMWFGKFMGTPLKDLSENYRWTIYRLGREKPSPLLQEYRQLHDLYTASLDEKQSPLSTKVWFGQHRGHELRTLYNAPRRWNWLVQNTVWGPELRGIQKRWLAWKAKHPRRPPVSRARPVIQNPVGSRLGPRDDGVASDIDEPYDTDDGFIVSDGDMGESDLDWDEDEWLDDEDDEDVEYFTDGEKSGDDTATLEDEEMIRTPSNHGGHGGHDGHDGDSDSSVSLPSVAEIVRRSATKNQSSPRLKKRYEPYAKSTPIRSRATRGRYAISSDDDDEDDDDMPIFTPSKSTGMFRKTRDFLTESDKTPKADTARVAARRMNHDSPSRAPKNSQSTVIVLSSDSETEQRKSPPSSRKKGSRNLPTSIVNVASVDSDDEPLVPKLRRERLGNALTNARG